MTLPRAEYLRAAVPLPAQSVRSVRKLLEVGVAMQL